MSRRIFFINPDASRSGVPVVLLNFMRWLKSSRQAVEMALLLIGTGPLLEEFKQLGPMQVWDRKRAIGPPVLPFKPDLVYYNSTGASVLGPTLPVGMYPTLCHVHELEFAIQTLTWPTKTPNLLTRHDRIIACADAVRGNLVANRNIAADRIDLVHEFVSYSEIQSRAARSDYHESLRRDHQLPSNALIVGGVGRIEWRKGTDLLVHITRALRLKSPDLPIYFFWIGGSPSSHEVFAIQSDVARLPELKGRVFFIPQQSDPLPMVAGFDLFILPSREDPFPLVCLEAAALGKPLVCFDQAGGMPEFIQSDAGLVVPYLDIDAMADAIICLLRDPQTRAKMGQTASQRVREHFDVSIAGPKLLESIERTIAGAKSTK